MSNKLAIVIMAHPERQEMARVLSQQLQAPIVYDRINNIWDTCRRAWLSQVSVGAEYTLVLQDDSIVCRDFRMHAEVLLQDDVVYSLYAGHLLAYRIKNAESKGKDYVDTIQIFNEVALCMRTEHIEEMVKYCDDHNANTDQEISNWARSKGLGIRYPIPSLVDHRDGESIYQRKYARPAWGNPRKAVRFKDK